MTAPDYDAFGRSVLEHVHAGLGCAGGVTPGVRFHHGMEYGDAGKAGDVQFVVTIVDDGPKRGNSRRVRRNWRESDPAAADLLVAYRKLATGP